MFMGQPTSAGVGAHLRHAPNFLWAQKTIFKHTELSEHSCVGDVLRCAPNFQWAQRTQYSSTQSCRSTAVSEKCSDVLQISSGPRRQAHRVVDVSWVGEVLRSAPKHQSAQRTQYSSTQSGRSTAAGLEKCSNVL
jgi:hypothetical protein